MPPFDGPSEGHLGWHRATCGNLSLNSCFPRPCASYLWTSASLTEPLSGILLKRASSFISAEGQPNSFYGSKVGPYSTITPQSFSGSGSKFA